MGKGIERPALFDLTGFPFKTPEAASSLKCPLYLAHEQSEERGRTLVFKQLMRGIEDRWQLCLPAAKVLRD